jgi:Holliday junction resolvase RusA-like endonuclease
VKFTIYGPTYSTNKLVKMHWAAKKRLRSNAAWSIVAAAANAGSELPPAEQGPPEIRMRVHLTICRRRRFDPDNVHGGIKILLDAMRDLALIKNDSPKWLDLKVDQKLEPDKALERTEVEIDPAEISTGGAP